MFYMLADVCLVIHTMPADCVDSVSTFRPTGKGGYRLLSPLVYGIFGALEGAQRKRGETSPLLCTQGGHNFFNIIAILHPCIRQAPVRLGDKVLFRIRDFLQCAYIGGRFWIVCINITRCRLYQINSSLYRGANKRFRNGLHRYEFCIGDMNCFKVLVAPNPV